MNKIEKQINTLIALLSGIFAICIISTILFLIMYFDIKDVKEYIDNENTESIETTVTIVDNIIPEAYDTITDSITPKSNIKNRTSQTINTIYNDKLVSVEDLSFLKIIDGSPTDIDDKQLEYIIKVGDKYHINPYLIATIIYIESRGVSTASNSSGYRGYGGIGKVTGKFMYEDILKLGTYDHDMAYDPYTNIHLIGTTLDYILSDGYDIYGTLQYYSGSKGEWWYINKAIKRLEETGGPTLDEIYKDYIIYQN